MVFFAKQYRILLIAEPVRVGSKVSAVRTDGMYLCDILSYSEKGWDGTKRPAFKVHIQSGDDDSNAFYRQFLTHFS
jgi:hypothetical protein